MIGERISHRYILKGKLHLESPLLIGCGAKSSVDSPVLKDSEGIPYIPGTSLGGVLRHHFRNQTGTEFSQEQIDQFWGSKQGGASKSDVEPWLQSSFFVSDLRPIGEPVVVVRDGVSINELGVAQDKKKYDYEVIEPGAVFKFRAEILVRKAFDNDAFLRIIAFLKNSLENGDIAIGSMTTKGFGRCRLINGECLQFDYSNKQHVLNWLSGDLPKENLIDLSEVQEVKTSSKDLVIEVALAVKNSLIVRSYSSNPKDPDAVHISSNGQAVLPGTSIKGALRARAERITNTLQGDSEMLKNLFGWASEDNDASPDKCRSRLIVEEAVIAPARIALEQQTRIRIDRFTGGVMDGALFNSMPVWSKNSTMPTVTLKMRIRNCLDWEAGLMMLVLKDLWNGDLPIGGEKAIGRGVFSGLEARLSYKGNDYKIKRQNEALQIEGEKAAMENWVTAFGNLCSHREEY